MEINWSAKQPLCKCNGSWLNRRQELCEEAITDQRNYPEFMRKQQEHELMQGTYAKSYSEGNRKISWMINAYVAEEGKA